MSAKRTERLLTLVMLLLSTRQGWTKEELFREIEQYEQAPTVAAREKLFDRDKATLRDQGIPLESNTSDPLFENDNASTRYRINAEDYRLPGMSFTAAESAALTIAAGMWEEASLGSAASRALRKLQGRGLGTESAPPLPIDARIRTNEPFWDELWQATSARRVIRFGYRAASTGEERDRTVQPWGMGSRFGNWYPRRLRSRPPGRALVPPHPYNRTTHRAGRNLQRPAGLLHVGFPRDPYGGGPGPARNSRHQNRNLPHSPGEARCHLLGAKRRVGHTRLRLLRWGNSRG